MYSFPTELWNELVDEFDLRDDYFDRAMFGTNCISVTGQVGDLLRFVTACQRIADELNLPGEELVNALAAAVRADNIGYKTIFYFPGITLDTGIGTRAR